MPIAPKPNKKGAPAAPVDERQIEQFINWAEEAPIGYPSVAKKKPTQVRFDPDTYARIEVIAKRRGLSMAAWVRYVVSQALESEDAKRWHREVKAIST